MLADAQGFALGRYVTPIQGWGNAWAGGGFCSFLGDGLKPYAPFFRPQIFLPEGMRPHASTLLVVPHRASHPLMQRSPPGGG